MRVVCAPDKFRGTATAAEAAAALAAGVCAAGGEAVVRPLADGGEGTLEVLGGANRTSVVTGPAGEPVEAGWRLSGTTAVVEMARASGLALAGGPERNDPLEATTAGTGELIARAVAAGARRVIVAVGGSATTDGGLGALGALSRARLRGVEIVVACDVRTRFVAAAEVFAPQKGAGPAMVELLRRRLERLETVYRDEYGVEVGDLVGAGAAGGLAGGLAAIGARLVDGFELVADEVGLEEAVEGADLVLTGEGRLDDASFEGKVVGGVTGLADDLGVPVVAVVGEVDPGLRERIVSLVPDGERSCRPVASSEAGGGGPDGQGVPGVVDLVAWFGRERAWEDTRGCLTEAARRVTALVSGGSWPARSRRPVPRR